ncbi:metal-dependent hydrolase [Luteococcus sp.]|uniref:metal-dependent hydrolase n=1 Tax=Luteococcus sp. TaxID=1969402 RepID=UPI003736ABEC
MLGYDHATMGAIAGLATMPEDKGLAYQAAWVATWTVAALWADFDMAGSSAARTWGPLTQTASGALGRLVGGHRWGTHDVVLAPAVLYWVLVPLAQQLLWGRYLLVALLLGLALRTFLKPGSLSDLSNLVLSSFGSWWLVSHDLDLQLPLAGILAMGVWVHTLGDLPTTEGLPVPVVWIFTRQRFSIPLFKVGGMVETRLVAPALSAVLVLIANQRLSWLNLPLPALFAPGSMPIHLPF